MALSCMPSLQLQHFCCPVKLVCGHIVPHSSASERCSRLMVSYLPRSLNLWSGRGKESRVCRLRKAKRGFSLWLTRMFDRSSQAQRSLTNLSEILVLLFQRQRGIIHSVSHIDFYFAICLCNCSWCHIVRIMSSPCRWWFPVLLFSCRQASISKRGFNARLNDRSSKNKGVSLDTVALLAAWGLGLNCSIFSPPQQHLPALCVLMFLSTLLWLFWPEPHLSLTILSCPVLLFLNIKLFGAEVAVFKRTVRKRSGTFYDLKSG